MLSVRMRLVLLIFYMTAPNLRAASIKKSIRETTTKPEIPTKSSKPNLKLSSIPQKPIPAIVAIEIVNGKEDSPISSKTTSKRTIESSLGYGYSSPSLGPAPPKKFVIYKYSQHDIPAFSQYNQGHGASGHANIQNSIGYHLGTTTTHIHHQPSVEVNHPVYQAPAQYYNPSTTLYTTFNHQGQLGGLSNQIPHQNLGHTGMVPVILLRVYSNQLVSPDTGLHTNLPESHPYAGLNNVNIQALLQNYVQHYLQTNAFQQQLYHSFQQAYTPQQHEDESHPDIPTYENYPSKHHTRVIFHSNNGGHLPEPPKSTYKTVAVPSYKTVPATYGAPQPNYVQVQTPDSHYAFTSGSHDADQQSYTYVYPSQLDQSAYYQQEEQGYAGGQAEKVAPVPPTATQESPDAPYNYHAHSHKERRSKKNTGVVTSRQSNKKRDLQLKTT